MATTTSDFDFLQGHFDVFSRRLRDPFDPASEWVDARATSSARTHFAGAISVDEMWFPAEPMYGMSLRVFDPANREWAVYWVNSRAGVLQPPVRGVWSDGRCWLTGPDEYAGRDIHASYAWSQVTERSAHWQQSFSVDGGVTWEPNWTMDFVRRETQPDHAAGPTLTSDFDFLAGTWQVQHRRRPDPLDDACDFREFDGVLTAYRYFNGAVSVDEISLGEPGRRGLTFRTYDPVAEEWSLHWVNSRIGRVAPPPLKGRFVDGVGTFHAVEEIGGRGVDVRFVWDDISPTTARWQQSFSTDGGNTWSLNWEMRLTREGGRA